MENGLPAKATDPANALCFLFSNFSFPISIFCLEEDL